MPKKQVKLQLHQGGYHLDFFFLSRYPCRNFLAKRGWYNPRIADIISDSYVRFGKGRAKLKASLNNFGTIFLHRIIVVGNKIKCFPSKLPSQRKGRFEMQL